MSVNNPTNAGVFTGSVIYQNAVSPPTLDADQDDYAPAGIENANVLRLDASVLVEISGIIAPPGPVFLQMVVFNIGSFSIRMLDNDAASAAANRLHLGGANILLQENESMILMYDAVSNFWRVVAEHS